MFSLDLLGCPDGQRHVPERVIYFSQTHISLYLRYSPIPDSVQCRCQSNIVLRFITAKDQHVVHLTEDSFEACKDLTHLLLKMFRCAANPEGKFVKIVTTKWSDKCRLGVRSLELSVKGICHAEPRVSIKFAEDLCTCQLG